MIDAIFSVHANPVTCGVTKFNVQLAERLQVPHMLLQDYHPGVTVHPLFSLKSEELSSADVFAMRVLPHRFDVLWHDKGRDDISAAAKQVFYASEMGCPSTLQGDSTRPGLNVLGFGFAHKFQQVHFERLRDLLDRHGAAYTVSMSAAVHEGREWETIAENERLVRGIFGEHARFLGYLADDALAREIRDCHMIALFYEPAVRANNTTLWAALEAGTPVITNLDADSPKELVHKRSVFDLAQLTAWPDASECREVRHGGRQAASVYSWDRLIGLLKAPAHV
jgi:hypothetical protein